MPDPQPIAWLMPDPGCGPGRVPGDDEAIAARGWWEAAASFWTNDGRYMPRTDCLVSEAGGPDWPWIIGLIVLTAGVIAWYLRIFVFWLRAYSQEDPRDRNKRMMELAQIFLWCAVCGYGMSIVMFFWPGYRLLALFLVVLNLWSWRFCTRLDEFGVALKAKRFERELRESLARQNERLEREVAERTVELEAARAAAERASEAKGMFLANMSHELRTPLTAILGFADLLVDNGQPADGFAGHAATIRRNGEHLLTVINDILDLSKIEAGAVTIDRTASTVRELIRDVVELMRGRASGKGLALHAEIEAGVPEVLSLDPTRTRQVLMNLLSNAIKFTEHGGVELIVGYEASSSTLTLRVRDSGIGMTDAQMARVFTAFSQADASIGRRFGGTGLGLTISRSLARGMGGDLTVSSAAGAGSTFTATLHAPPATLVAATRDPAGQVQLDGLRVLVADDGIDNQRLVSFLLRRAGASVEVVGDGRRAVEAAMASLPDIVLMDMQMPEMDGVSATRALRSRGYAGPVLALTANAMPGAELACLEAGCNGYVRKPFQAEALIAAVARATRAEGDHERRRAA